MRRGLKIVHALVEFIAGDDWLTAAGVVVALALTSLAARSGSGWWVMPLAVMALLALSLWRAAAPSRRQPRPRRESLSSPDAESAATVNQGGEADPGPS